MVPINLSDNLMLGERTLHLQTHYRFSEFFVVITLFEHGQVLSKERSQIPDGLDETALKQWILKEHQESMELLTFLFSIDEKVKSIRHIQSLSYLGSLYLRWGLLSEAICAFEAAAKIDFENIEAADLLCEAYIQHGEFEKAILLLNPYLESTPEQATLWLTRGKANLILKKYEEAFTDFKESIRLAPHVSKTHLFLSLASLHMVHNDLGNDEINSMDAGVQLCTVHLAAALKHSNQLFRSDLDPILQNLNGHDLGQAIQGISDIVSHLKESIDLGFHQSFYLRFLYGTKTRKLEAIPHYTQKLESLIRQNPNHVHLKMYLGMGYVIQCREMYQKALHEFHAVRDRLKGQNCYEKSLHEADRLGEQFIQLIKMLFQ